MNHAASPPDEIQIRHMHELPHLRDQLGQMLYDEFWAGVEGVSPQSMARRLAQAQGSDALPLCRVATSGGQALGLVNLIEYDDPNPRVGSPWLAGMLVRPDQRGRGLGARLVRTLLDDAQRLGQAQLFLGTDGPGFYARLGAQVHQQLRADFWIMRFELPPR
jgi:predicted N-acetyltransferase YhbS